VLKKRYRGSRDKAKTGEKAQFSELNEHFEPVFNAVSGNADSFSTSCWTMLKPSGDLHMGIVNTEIKPFQATAFKQGEFVEITEADVKGKWAVFFFYPADFTFVCPTELGDVADKYEELQKLGVEVFSVSTDTHFTHKAWHDSSETINKIQYYMVGDQTGNITNNFGVMREGQGLADRATFLIDPQGIIQAVEITAEGIGRDADDLLRKVKAAQYVAAHPGEVCPAKWKEGEATLAPSLDLVGKI
jgi:peroxiredoxin (alkyl hydroperoxide reductase subunit C)